MALDPGNRAGCGEAEAIPRHRRGRCITDLSDALHPPGCGAEIALVCHSIYYQLLLDFYRPDSAEHLHLHYLSEWETHSVFIKLDVRLSVLLSWD